MYLPRGWKIQARIKEKKGAEVGARFGCRHTHGRAWEAETGCEKKGREMEGENGSVFG